MTSIESKLYENCKASFYNYYLGLNYLINSEEEFMTLLQMAGLNPPNHKVKLLWKENKDSFTFNRFCQASSQFQQIDKKSLLGKFKKLDKNDNGYLNKNDILKMLSQYNQGRRCDDVKVLLNEMYFENDRFYYEKFCDDFELATEKLLNLMKNELDSSQKEKSPKGILKATKVEKPIKTLKKEIFQYNLGTLNIINKINSTIFRTYDFKKYHYTSLNGCFYYDASDVMWSHVYELKVTHKCSPIIYISPIQRSNFIFTFLLDQFGHLAGVSSLKDQNGVYITNLKLQPGTYTLVPYAINSPISVKKDYKSTILVRKDKSGQFRLSERCLTAVTKAFEILDLNNDGFLDLLEFNFYYLLTTGETINQEIWLQLKTKGFATDSGVSLHDLINLMELELKANSGQVHDIWTTLILLGFDSSLNCVKNIPFEMTCFNKNNKKLTFEVKALRNTNSELIKIFRNSQSQNVQKRTIPVLSDFSSYSINTDLFVLIIYDNQLDKQVEIEYNVSDSHNLQSINSKFSGNFKLMPKSKSNSFGYISCDNVSEYKFTSNEIIRITE